MNKQALAEANQRTPHLALTGARRAIALTLPCLVLLLSILAWIGGLLQSSFWADDFQNLVFFHGFHNFFNMDFGQGQFSGNLFWTLGTMAFGSGSDVPYLLLNSSILAAGLAMWTLACNSTRWSELAGWWVIGLLIANAAWLEIALWSSNSTHSFALFGLGAGMLCHQRVLTSDTSPNATWWSIAGAMAWTLTVLSDPLYIGIIVLATYAGWTQKEHFQRWFRNRRIPFLIVGWNILPPILYFLFIGYPQKIRSAIYSGSSIRFFPSDFHFYYTHMAPNAITATVYILLFVFVAVVVIGSAFRRDYFPLACFLAALIMVGIILTESHQRFENYTVLPFLLTVSAGAAGWRTCLRSPSLTPASLRFARRATLIITALVLGVLFNAGSQVRSYFDATPFGAELVPFRDQVSSLVPKGAQLCVVLELSPSGGSLIAAEMDPPYGFMTAPINAAGAYLVVSPSQCPDLSNAIIDVRLSAEGEFQASISSERSSPVR
jgi:hypothetical protein